MIRVNTHEAKTRLSALLAAVEKRGEIVILCRSGRPVAEIRPFRRTRSPLRRSTRLSKIVFREDPTKPLAPSDWPDSAR